MFKNKKNGIVQSKSYAPRRTENLSFTLSKEILISLNIELKAKAVNKPPFTFRLTIK